MNTAVAAPDFAAPSVPDGAAIRVRPGARSAATPAARCAAVPEALDDPPPAANVWLCQLFDAKAARTGGVVRRRLRDVETIVGLAKFRDEVDRRGFTAITDGAQVVIFCHAGGVRRLA